MCAAYLKKITFILQSRAFLPCSRFLLVLLSFASATLCSFIVFYRSRTVTRLHIAQRAEWAKKIDSPNSNKANNSNHKLFIVLLPEKPLAQTQIHILLFKFQSSLQLNSLSLHCSCKKQIFHLCRVLLHTQTHTIVCWCLFLYSIHSRPNDKSLHTLSFVQVNLQTNNTNHTHIVRYISLRTGCFRLVSSIYLYCLCAYDSIARFTPGTQNPA